MKRFLERLVSLLPYALLIVVGGVILISVANNGIDYDHLIELLKVLIWPIIVLIAMMFFQRVFTYLFFSMEEFNFFGAKGGLKDVRQIIREKVDELRTQEQEVAQREAERAAYKVELEELKHSNASAEERIRRALSIAERNIARSDDYARQNRALQTQIEALINQVGAGRSGDVGYYEDIGAEEEQRDVGKVNPTEDSSAA